MDQQELRFIAVVRDIFFGAKITAAAKRVGVAVQFIHDEAKLLEATAGAPSLVMIDLNDVGLNSVELVRKLKANPNERPVQIIGFLSHVQMDLMREAKQAGCDSVLPRSAFSQNLDEILRQHLSPAKSES